MKCSGYKVSSGGWRYPRHVICDSPEKFMQTAVAAPSFLSPTLVIQVLVEQKEISGEEIDFILDNYPPQTSVSHLLQEENPGSLPFSRQEQGLKLEDTLLTPSKGFI